MSIVITIMCFEKNKPAEGFGRELRKKKVIYNTLMFMCKKQKQKQNNPPATDT